MDRQEMIDKILKILDNTHFHLWNEKYAEALVDNGIGELGFHNVCEWWIKTYPTSLFKNEIGAITHHMEHVSKS